MKKTEFRNLARDLIASDVDDCSLDDKIAIVRQTMIDAQQDAGFDESAKGKPWSDDELRIVLGHTPTKENCIRLARAFRRGYGSVEQIFRWAATTGAELREKGRENDSFVKQIHRVAKEIGWRAT